ncbi:Nn.00g117760.m01.CDS01 [Neocucurbitaria sp. VM-36]
MATVISNRPSSSFNWADDDEDDFDFECWQATADTSAPTIKDLGPLQLPPTDDDPHFTVISPPATNNSAALSAIDQSPCVGTSLQDQQSCDEGQVHVPDWQREEAHACLVHRALKESSDAPAYCEMSFYDDWSLSPYKRVNYTQNWNRMKANSGFDCRRPVQFRLSALRQVTFADEVVIFAEGQSIITGPTEDNKTSEQTSEIALEENIEAYEQFSEIDLEDLPQLQHGDNETDEEEMQTRPIWPPVSMTCEPDGGELTLVKTAPTNITIVPQIEVESNFQDAQDAHDLDEDTTKSNTHQAATNEPLLTSTTTTVDVEFDFSDIFEDAKDPYIPDEGYQSASPPISPTLPTCDEDLNLSFPMISLGIRPAASFTRRKHYECHDSLDALIESGKSSENEETVEDTIDGDEDTREECKIDILREEPLEAVDHGLGLLSTSPPPTDAAGCEVVIVDDEPRDTIDYTSTTTPSSNFSHDYTTSTPIIAKDMSSPDIKCINQDPGIANYVFEAVSTGCFLLSLVPWTTVGIVAAGAVVGGVLHLTRRR